MVWYVHYFIHILVILWSFRNKDQKIVLTIARTGYSNREHYEEATARGFSAEDIFGGIKVSFFLKLKTQT